MHRTSQHDEDGPVTEMAIVNAFTRLIFGDECSSERELLIIQALRSVEPSVLRDTPQELGGYLRNLGVREMIQLVARVRQHIMQNVESPGVLHEPAATSATSTRPGPNRGTH